MITAAAIVLVVLAIGLYIAVIFARFILVRDEILSMIENESMGFIDHGQHGAHHDEKQLKQQSLTVSAAREMLPGSKNALEL